MTSSNGNILRVSGLLWWNSLVTGEFHLQRPVMRSFDVFFDLCLDKRLSKQLRRVETTFHSLWRHCNVLHSLYHSPTFTLISITYAFNTRLSQSFIPTKLDPFTWPSINIDSISHRYTNNVDNHYTHSLLPHSRSTFNAHSVFTTSHINPGLINDPFDKITALYILNHNLYLSCPLKATNTMHYDDVIMGAMASQITSLTIVYTTVYSDADQRKHQSSASLAFVRGIHQGPVNSPHKWPVTRKMSPFDDVIMVKDYKAAWCASCTWNQHISGKTSIRPLQILTHNLKHNYRI